MGRTYREYLNEKLKDPAFKKEWDETVGDRMVKLCIIGQNLDKKQISAELDACLA